MIMAETTLASAKSDLGCGSARCGMDSACRVTDAGMLMLACPACGVLRIPPEELTSDHVDPDPVGKLSIVMKTLFSMRMAWLRSEVPELKRHDIRYLDVGCGDGQFLSFLKMSGYSAAVGIEPDAARAANARQRFLPVYASVEEARLAREIRDEVDVISVWHVMEHVDRPILFLKLYATMLSPDGVMLVSVPNQKSAQTRLFGRYAAYPDYGRHIWYQDPSYLDHLGRELNDYDVSILRDRNYEYEIFAWVETLISAALRDPCFVNRTLKKGQGSLARKLVTAVAAAALLPMAAAFAPFSINLRAPSTLTFAIRKKRLRG
jgi:SAM-dependent methyltransferase